MATTVQETNSTTFFHIHEVWKIKTVLMVCGPNCKTLGIKFCLFNCLHFSILLFIQGQNTLLYNLNEQIYGQVLGILLCLIQPSVNLVYIYIASAKDLSKFSRHIGALRSV